MSVFVDTNILVYAHDVDAGDRHVRCRELVRAWWSGPTPPFISVQVLQELYVNLVRKGVSKLDAGEVIEDYASWPVIATDTALVLAATRGSGRWTISFWDALIVEAARRAGAESLYSEDLNPGQSFEGVTVVNPLR